MAVNEVVDDNGLMTCCHQLLYTMTADITGAAGNENFHGGESY